MSTSKIRIKLGPIEVEYEGSDDFLRKELPELLEAVSKLHKESGHSVTENRADSSAANNGERGNNANGSAITGTTVTIASKLGSSSGGEMIVAAAAQLTYVEGKEEFTTKQLRAACRAGKHLWKKSYTNNFTNYLATLVNDKSLHEVREGVYALSAKKRQSVEAVLASA